MGLGTTRLQNFNLYYIIIKGGKDRTGVLTALILLLLDVDDKRIIVFWGKEQL